MRRLLEVLSMTALALAAVAVCAAGAQPPVARPQPPPPAPTAKAPAKPADTKADPAPATPQQPGAKPQGAPVAPPQPGAKPSAAPAAPPQAAPAAVQAPRAAPDSTNIPPAPCQQGAPVLAGAQYLESYDAGMGQTYCLYGSAQTFADVVAYYRTVLKDRGELVFDAPATHMFEVGKFKETDVAFPPGVTVKDYTWSGSPGYTNQKPGATPAFFPTVIQIVPPPSAPAGRRD